MRYYLKSSGSIFLIYLSITTCYATDFGGLKLKSVDGKVEFALNGRGHFDVHSLYPDSANANNPAFGSQLLSSNDRDGFNWRRTYATLTGKIYGVNFKFENDFAINATTEFPHSLREAWISAKLGPGQLTIGQFKPYRGLEEITSSNELTLMERPSTSSTGIYNGRQFLTGFGYRSLIRDNIGLGVHVMSLAHFGQPVEGISYGGRAVWLPIDQAGHILHLGLSLSRDTTDKHSISAKIVDVYGGRQGISQHLGTAGAGDASSGSPSQSTISTELAYSINSLTLQAEYALAKLDHTHSVNQEIRDSTIQAFYLQGSWFVTGEQAVYKKDRGAFGKPKPTRGWGALELAGRYDFAENLQQSRIDDPCRTSTSKCQVQVITFGVNWYPTANIRFMLNYYISEAMLGTLGLGVTPHKDHLSTLSFRTQINF